jgi:hypothetical protein
VEIETQIRIEAPPARVWAVLTDFAAFPEWNPFVREISGDARPGARLRIQIHPPARSAMRFTPTVLRAEANRELRWKGKLLLPGLFDGEHVFRLRRDGEGTRFEHSERFSGLLVRFMPASLWRATRLGFEAMNDALKTRAEAGSGSRGSEHSVLTE